MEKMREADKAAITQMTNILNNRSAAE